MQCKMVRFFGPSRRAASVADLRLGAYGFHAACTGVELAAYIRVGQHAHKMMAGMRLRGRGLGSWLSGTGLSA